MAEEWRTKKAEFERVMLAELQKRDSNIKSVTYYRHNPDAVANKVDYVAINRQLTDECIVEMDAPIVQDMKIEHIVYILFNSYSENKKIKSSRGNTVRLLNA